MEGGASFLLLLFLLSPIFAADTIAPGSPLLANQTLVSSAGAFALGFFSPAGTTGRYAGVWFDVAVREYVWVANRDRPVTGSNSTLAIAANGTLSLTDGDSVIWSVSSPSPLQSAVAQLLESGSLVIKESAGGGAAAWQSFEHPTDTLLAGMKLGMNTTLTSWKSDTDPSPGSYKAYIDLTGDPQMVVVSAAGSKMWRSSQTAGVPFGPVPASLAGAITFTWGAAAVSYELANGSAPTMLRMNSSGALQLWQWSPAPAVWNMKGSVPSDACDVTSACGANSFCSIAGANKPTCTCLQGFLPDAAAPNTSCKAAARHDCLGGTDLLTTLQNAKLPDMAGTTWNASAVGADCRSACLANCSCTAYANTNLTGGGSGCVMWFGDLVDLRKYSGSGGQDLYVRSASAVASGPVQSRGNSSGGSVSAGVIAGLSAAGVVLLIAMAGFFIWRRLRKKQKTGAPNKGKNVKIPGLASDDLSNIHDDMDFPLLDLDLIAAATDNFSDQNKLGQGGFGPVYKGTLPDGREVAVKRNARTSSQGVDEFKNEVKLVAKLQHRNLVRLIGCSIYRRERILVYEYMPNKSLDTFIFNQAKSVRLDWQVRYQIIVGIAKGLMYLHEGSRLKIIHRDLKASNILLDKDMNPKISDFGIARIFDAEGEINTLRVVGTYGYMSPEYALEGTFSVKSDVFSFGILVLEIISGRKNRGGHFTNNLSLVDYAWRLWKNGKVLKLVDESMDCSYPTEEVVKCIKLALMCVQERPEDRPVMSSVISMFDCDAASLPDPKKPGYTAMRGFLDSESSTSKSIESNSVPITVLDPR